MGSDIRCNRGVGKICPRNPIRVGHPRNDLLNQWTILKLDTVRFFYGAEITMKDSHAVSLIWDCHRDNVNTGTAYGS